MHMCDVYVFSVFLTGYLSVLVNQCWKEQWCRVRCGSLHLHQEKVDGRRNPHTSIVLHGCEVVPGLGPKHPFALRILRGGTEVAVLEVQRLSSGKVHKNFLALTKHYITQCWVIHYQITHSTFQGQILSFISQLFIMCVRRAPLKKWVVGLEFCWQKLVLLLIQSACTMIMWMWRPSPISVQPLVTLFCEWQKHKLIVLNQCWCVKSCHSLSGSFLFSVQMGHFHRVKDLRWGAQWGKGGMQKALTIEYLSILIVLIP